MWRILGSVGGLVSNRGLVAVGGLVPIRWLHLGRGRSVRPFGGLVPVWDSVTDGCPVPVGERIPLRGLQMG